MLSVVNGVQMPFGEAPPGARGVLPVGETLMVGDYSVCAAAAQSPPVAAPDPWAIFERESSGLAPLCAPDASTPSDSGAESTSPSEDDPFGDWEFEATSGARMPAMATTPGGPMQPGDLSAFFEGLGLEPASIGPIGRGELEAMGRLVRMLMLGVLELHKSSSMAKDEMRAEDRTMVAAKDNNPLKSGWPAETKLRYLLGGRAASIGFPNPERALGELLVELAAHNGASANASRAALESTLKEFSPAALRARLLAGGSRLFEGTRAWDAYCRYYEREGQDMARWTQRMLDRYYSEAYLRESLRIKRETRARPR